MTKKVTVLIFSVAVFSFSFHNGSTSNGKAKGSRLAFYLKNYSSPKNLLVDYPKEQFSFCGEVMPVGNAHYEKLYREVNKYLSYPRGLKNMLNRADYWMPKISKKLAHCDLPQDLKYLPLIESKFLNDTSGKGAIGFWQFMPQTARGYGLEVTDSLDERLDPVKSTDAACQYLHELEYSYDSWSMVVAAYNYGQGNVAKKISSSSKLDPSYFDISWNAETGAYVYKLMAIKYITEHRKELGL